MAGKRCLEITVCVSRSGLSFGLHSPAYCPETRRRKIPHINFFLRLLSKHNVESRRVCIQYIRQWNRKGIKTDIGERETDRRANINRQKDVGDRWINGEREKKHAFLHIAPKHTENLLMFTFCGLLSKYNFACGRVCLCGVETDQWVLMGDGKQYYILCRLHT